MIKNIQLDDWSTLEDKLKALLPKDYTHFIIENEAITIDEDMLEAVELKPQTIIVDYAIDNTYLNDAQYFNQHEATFEAWMNNSNHYPNVIFHIETVLHILEDYTVDHLFDLALLSLLKGNSFVDRHIVYDFHQSFVTSSGLWEIITELNFEHTTQFLLNVLAYEHQYSLPYSKKQIELPQEATPIQRWLKSTRFKAPRFLYNAKCKRELKQFKKDNYVYDKDPNKLKNHIVFLGHHYRFQGNSRYLFNHLAKHYSKTTVYFITDEVKGPNFLEPETKETNELIESAKVVILEDLMPDHLHPNGKVVQLWHGTPIKRLFFDRVDQVSSDNHKPSRAKVFNKWAHQDYLICDSEASEPYFETGFPSKHLDFISCGYPRVRYLLDKVDDKPYLSFIQKELKLDPNKQTLLYAPTKHTHDNHDDILPVSDGLVKKYNIIYRPHPDNEGTFEPEQVITAPSNIETQDLILVADFVLTDYSSLIFDALTADKTICQYTPNQEVFDQQRGVYEEVMQSLSTVRYSDKKALHNDLISHQMTTVKSNPFINTNNQSYEQISTLIDSIMKN
ncbi:CDP-glycerol glycerophosphotransferase family protein [Staphylococcus sp. SQ8-PEA]|uniref:CDP-glycerol glycerophosphotransferase family protein n=1 Tax=Staphylococcus marylandisciuri TaxID=2981529 RepID=A0ABT2QMQ6_9STAP|nr:CDP-glycerol glycerophosphotransferase family protein [Staphylococcus marylandisciuri]MCU5745262.1 CDP-glycerol glycerophosphotransferase family protein [Staphylococcus marylandisciuri]